MDLVSNNLEVLRLANHDFSSILYSKLNNNNENLFYSSLSIHVVMLMAGMGAATQTFNEIFDTIQLPKNKSLIKSYGELLSNVDQKNDVLKLASGIFIEKSFNLKKSYLTTVTKNLNSSVNDLDFINHPDDQRNFINQWVENKTDGKIKELFDPDSIDSKTVLVLTSALHFKSNWKYEFNIPTTEPFNISPQKNLLVSMMNLNENLKYYHDQSLKFAALELPYENHKFKMIVLLPDAKDGLANLELNLSKIKLAELLNKLKLYNVDVKLPRFKIEQTIDLKTVLSEIGCSTMFTPNADFSEISDIPLKISKAVHKAYIDINEKGTEAAASTGFTFVPESIIISETKEKVEFYADHPFIFTIWSNKNDVLFMGRVIKPSHSLNTNNENLFYSPLSIHVVLLMAGIGATSKTSDEIFDTIHLPRNKSLIEAYDYLLNDIGRYRNSANLVTGMFVEKTFKIKSSYAEKIKKHLKSTVENLDFNKKSNDQRNYINEWIKNKTNGKINNLFPADSINESTVMVLTSALHFKCLWNKKFSATNDEPFYSVGQNVIVKMMYQQAPYNYYHDKKLKFAALDMPYRNFYFKMLILLPDAKDGLSNLENNLSKINFIKLYKNMTKHDVDFKFPKFKIEQEIDLNHVLNKLGCSTMFTPSADFSGITDVPIFANKAFHKAFIDVDEKGTEAAAASRIECLEGSAMPTILPKAQFHVDHPFIFAILTEKNDILFLGNLKKP
ncbi:serpin B10-like [Daktulosphaira vitifoliae]|uniref:serpin B10-like n=1 Tax=Daktulosphaira vitifoliae TaxID=58002 RepID=UPI0021A9EA79|nr:serpin B10-like [Daktulosphaira vitifoliae]